MWFIIGHCAYYVHILKIWQTHRTWTPASLVLQNVIRMETHWCLQLRKDTEVAVKVQRDGNYSDQSSSSNSEESSSLSLHSTAIRRDRMAATSLPKWSLFSCSRCASTLRRLNPKIELVRTATVSACPRWHLQNALQAVFCHCSHRQTVIYQYTGCFKQCNLFI